MPSLFTSARNSQATQLAYKIKFFPVESVDPDADVILDSGLILNRRVQFMRKYEITKHLNEDWTKLYDRNNVEYQIHWAYNNIPTEIEWNKWDIARKFRLEFRQTKLGHFVIISN